MVSPWAFALTQHPNNTNDVGGRVSRESTTWSQQVEDVYNGNHYDEVDVVAEKKKTLYHHHHHPTDNELYLENATSIAFLLVEQIIILLPILKEAEKTTVPSLLSGNNNIIQMDNITITLDINRTLSSGDEAPQGLKNGGGKGEVRETVNKDHNLREMCKIKSVTIAPEVLHVNQSQQQDQQEQPSIFQSLGLLLLKLYTRQDPLTSDWETSMYNNDGYYNCESSSSIVGEDQDATNNQDGTSINNSNDDSAEFESDMLRALSFLDSENVEEEEEQEQEQSSIPIKRRHNEQMMKQRHNSYSLTELSNNNYTIFSRIRNRYLSTLLLPTSVCRLVSDLIDATTAATTGSKKNSVRKTKTSFTSLHDVLSDLEQMVMSPTMFLHELRNNATPTTLPTTLKLDFGSKLHGRREEISQLMDIVDDISSLRVTGPLEIVSLGGYSGSGKSYLIRQVGRYLSNERGWIFIQGKFDRLRQNYDAFSVVTSAFERFCGQIDEMRENNNNDGKGNNNIGGDDNVEYCSRVSTAVLEALGRTGVDYLSQIMPSLRRVVNDVDYNISGDQSGDDSTSAATGGSSLGGYLHPTQTGDEALMSQRRCEYLLCAFVEAILGVGRPLLLFYDDMQWADASTLEFLRKLLKHLADRNKARKNIMFVEAFRDNIEVKENGNDPVYNAMTSSMESYDSVNITKIKLGGFSKSSLNNILSSVLCLPRRVTCPLSEMIHQKTMGNIFYVIEFMKTLVCPDNNILTYSLAKRRWIWDADSVAVMSISDSVADLLVKKLLCVEKAVLKSLIMASCFGCQVNVSVMELLNGMEGIDNMVQNLEAAVDEGLLEKAGPLFMFAHDSIQQSVYELTPTNELVKLHVDIGLMLISKSATVSKGLIEQIFASAVGHINMALPECPSSSSVDGSGDGGAASAVEFTSSQHIVFAKLNLKAGQKAAIGKSDFSLAEVHLKAGISFLPKNSWTDQYELTLQLSDEYANVLYVQRNLDELQSHVAIILNNAKCMGDKIKAHEFTISAMLQKGSEHLALDHARSVLDSLGFPFPATVGSETVKGIVDSLVETTMAYTPDQLRAFPLMTDKIPLQAMKIMSAIRMQHTFSSPTLFQMLACQMMQLTIKHGLSVESAEAFANFGYCVNAVLLNYGVGYRIGKLALVILERLKATTRVARVYFLVYGFLSLWKEPLQATIEGLQSAINTGLVEGDKTITLYNQSIMCRQMIIAGFNLSETRDKLLRLCWEMMYDKSEHIFSPAFHPTLGDLYVVMYLTGESTDEVYSIFGISPEENEKKLFERYSATNNASVIQLVYYHRMLKSFWFRDYETVIECCEKYVTFKTSMKMLRITDIIHIVFWGLSSLILSRRRNEKELITEGEEAHRKMEFWAKNGSKWNAENKAFLLEAEINFAKGNTAKATTAYEKAIESAHDHKFINEEALACELFGIFCIEEGNLYKGNELLEKARELYEMWGAKKKARSIFYL